MMPFIKSEATKAALITLETQIQAASQRGATALSVYLENFCAKLLEIYYGYGFCNLNYEKKNVKVECYTISAVDKSPKIWYNKSK